MNSCTSIGANINNTKHTEIHDADIYVICILVHKTMLAYSVNNAVPVATHEF